MTEHDDEIQYVYLARVLRPLSKRRSIALMIARSDQPIGDMIAAGFSVVDEATFEALDQELRAGTTPLRAFACKQ